MRMLIEVSGGGVTRITRTPCERSEVFLADHDNLEVGDKFTYTTFPTEAVSRARFAEMLEECVDQHRRRHLDRCRHASRAELAEPPAGVPDAHKPMGVRQAEQSNAIPPERAMEWVAPDGLD